MTATDEKQTVTFMVSECSEYHNMGDFYENIKTIGEAKRIYESIDPDRLHAIPAVGINIHTEGTPDYEDTEWDFYSGNIIDLTMLEYLPQVTECREALMALAQIMEAFPMANVYGKMTEELKQIRDEIRYGAEAFESYRNQAAKGMKVNGKDDSPIKADKTRKIRSR